MYRGTSNPDYGRLPVPPSGFGHPAASFGPPPFCPPFGVPPGPPYCVPPPAPPPGRPYGAGNENYNRESFYENRPFASHTADQSGSTLINSLLKSANQLQLGHTSNNWSTQSLDEQNQEVRKKAEEFLRILEASDRIELPGDKNDSGTGDKHPSQTCSRSRGRSRPRSRSRSRGKSRGRSQARIRGKSRARSKTRSRSRTRGKSHTRAKSRVRSRSRSRSHGKSGTRSKSQSRPSPNQTKQSSRGTAEGNHNSSSASSGISLASSAMPDLFHGLKQILQNKDLDKHLPLVKNALLRSQECEMFSKQNTEDTRGMFPANQYAGFQNLEPEASAELRYGSMLPHERAGGDGGSFSNILSWNTPNQQPETKPAFQTVEDEEKFLYGEEEERSKPQAVTVPLAQTRSVRSPVHHLSKENQTHGLQEPKAHAVSASVPPAASGTTKVTPEECEKVRTLLRTIGLNPGMADICKMAARLKEKKGEQGTPASLSMLKPTLEALQALSRVTKTDDSRSNRSGSSHSNHDSKREGKKTNEKERDRREKQIQKKRKEYLVKELEGLLKQEGEGDLIPVMGFFCQRCEEFFGDMNSAERHVESHSHKDRNKTSGSQEQHRDAKRHEDQHHTSSHRRESPHSRSSRVYQDHKERSPDRKRTRDERSPHSTDIKVKKEPEGKDSKDESKDKYKEKRDKPDDDDDAESTKSEKKKKKKEKKMKKKEKKKKKDKEKKKAEKDSP
ncbi:serine/arginine repetitive matrix protein 2-like isoform X1 [Carassius auratus]|uniref:Serine/arginine repetitive matrix protein 2-like isoform X1 n=1 Tax=Carassius auratus TaxID=7957 RepID=A0A6P6R682_CARAU|nr:serine/arginine repetitive matrix protein 2-like isoform X1 [Carassius auratus]